MFIGPLCSRCHGMVGPLGWSDGLFITAMQKTEDRWNEDQSCNGREEQTANDSASQRSILFSAVAGSQRHRYHADDHRQRGHRYGAETGCPRFDRGKDSVSMMR